MTPAMNWRRFRRRLAPILLAMRQYYVYIMASLSRRLYVGVTNALRRRVWEHKMGALPGFTRKYRVTTLAYFEVTSDPHVAIAREKQLKRWPRQRKHRLIEMQNAGWVDLTLG
jgi:putative endonuclease